MAENTDMLGFTLQALQQAGQKQQALVTDTVSKLKDLTGQGLDASDEMVAAVLGGTVDREGNSMLSREVAELGQLKVQEKQQEFYNNLAQGEGFAKFSNRMADIYTSTMQEALDVTAEISDRSSVGFFDNPIEHIWNQLMLPDAHQKLNGLVTKADAAAGILTKTNSMMQQTAATENAYALKTSEAAIASKSEALANNLKAEAAKAKMTAIANQSHNLVTVMNASQQQLDNISRVISARNQEVHTQLAVEAAGRERVKFGEWQKQVKDKEVYENQMLEYINYGAKETGAKEFDSPKILAMIRSGQPLPAKLAKLAEIGFVNSGTGLHQLSQTPAGTMEVASVLNLPIPKGVATIYEEAKRKLAAETQTPQGAVYLKDKQAAEIRFNAIVTELAKSKQVGIDPKDGSNPYLAPSTKVMAQSSEIFKNSKLYTNVLKPQIDQGLDTTDPTDLLRLGMEGVRTGKLSLSELASDVRDYYRSARILNNTDSQFNRFAIPEAEGYKARVKILSDLAGKDGEIKGFNPFSSYSTVTMDMEDITQVSRYLLKAYKAQEGTDIMGSLKGLWNKPADITKW